VHVEHVGTDANDRESQHEYGVCMVALSCWNTR
jgi:hypothetical protein